MHPSHTRLHATSKERLVWVLRGVALAHGTDSLRSRDRLMTHRLCTGRTGLYRELMSSDIVCLPPIQLAFYLLASFVPLLHCRLGGDGVNIDDVHRVMSVSARQEYAPLSKLLTVVGRNEFIHPVVWLAASDTPRAVVGPLWKLVWPVHPVDSCVDVVPVACADLQDACDPVGHGFLSRLHRLVPVRDLLLRDATIICDVDKAP